MSLDDKDRAGLRMITGYAKARGYTVSAPAIRERLGGVYYVEVGIRDYLGQEVELAFIAPHTPCFIDGNGQMIDEISAALFDELTVELERRPRPDRRQLCMFA